MSRTSWISGWLVVLAASVGANGADFIKNGSFTDWYSSWSYGGCSYQLSDLSYTRWGSWVLGWGQSWDFVYQTIAAADLPASQAYRIDFAAINGSAPLDVAHRIQVTMDYYDAGENLLNEEVRYFPLAANRDWQTFGFSSRTPANLDHTLLIFRRVSDPVTGAIIALDAVVGSLPMAVSGRADIQGYVGDYTTVGLNFVLQPAEGGDNVTRQAFLDATGGFTLPDILPGSYTVFVRGLGTLTAKAEVTIPADTPVIAEPIVLKTADSNGDNAVNFSDFSILQNSYGRHGGAAAVTPRTMVAHAVDGILSAGEWASLYSDPAPDKPSNGCVELVRWGAEVRDGVLYGAFELDPAGPAVAEFDTYPMKKLWLGLWIDADPAASPATAVVGGDDQFTPRVQDINIELGMDKGPLLGSPTWNSLNFWGRDNSFDNITPVTVNAAYQGHVVEFAVPVADIMAELARTDGVVPGNIWRIGARAAGHVSGEDYAGDITDLQSVTVFGIEGCVVLQSYQGDNTTAGVRCVFTPTGSGASLSRAAVLDADGVFILDPVPAGTYNVSVKSGTSLSAALSNVTVGSGVTDLGTIELVNADSNGDDQVSFEDFSILQNNYGETGAVASPLSAAAADGGCGSLGLLLVVCLGVLGSGLGNKD